MPAEPPDSGGTKGPAEPGSASQASPPAGNTNPWAIAFGAGSEIVVSVLGGVFVGKWFDRKFDTSPWLMLAGTMLGIIVGLYQLVKATSRRRSGR